MKIRIQRNSLAMAALVLMLAACGGSDDSAPVPPPAPPPPPPAGTLIGAAGGTVTGPNGAQVVIPAGALATEVRINIEQTTVGAPALPGGFSVSGLTFAFTPHGTTFAVPVTMTLPFDPASVPAGTTPVFYKTTNAQTQWEQVPNAVFGAASVSAQVSSFSIAQIVIEPLHLIGVQRHVRFEPIGQATEHFDDNEGVLDARRLVGPAGLFEIPFDGDNTSALEVFSAADGIPFWVGSESGKGLVALHQSQAFVKLTDDATLEVVLTAALLEVLDFNLMPGFSECPNGPGWATCTLIQATILFEAELTVLTPWGEDFLYLADPDDDDDTPVLDTGTTMQLRGHAGEWLKAVDQSWDRMSSAFTYANVEMTDDVNDDAAKIHPRMRLTGPVVIPVDLSGIERFDTFWINTDVFAVTRNKRGRESGVGAFVRDPAKIGGATLNFTGLQRSSAPRPTPRVARRAIPCATGPDPQAGELQFSAPVYVLMEGAFAEYEASDILITRSNGSTGNISATLTVDGGTAAPGVHYNPIAATVVFADGDTTPRAIGIDILQNGNVEADTTVNLTLSAPGGCATLGAQASALLRIRDDDSAPTPPSFFTVGGVVTGLSAVLGSNLVLEDHHGLFLEITGDGPFVFATLPSPAGTAYSVRVFNQPRNLIGIQTQTCIVTNGTGIFGDANVTNVQVICADL